MTRWLRTMPLLGVLVLGDAAGGQTTRPAEADAPAATSQPAEPDIAQIRIRANQAFAAGEYGIALPLFKLIEPTVADEDELANLRERMRVCQRMLELGAGVVETEADVVRVPHEPPEDGKTRELTIKELGNFAYDGVRGGNVPPDVARLSGSSIRVSGYMIPLDQSNQITVFALVPSLLDCCFGQPPQVHHVVTVRCPPGKGIAYYPELLVIEGTLNVEEIKGQGMVLSLFELEATRVEPAPQ